MKTARAFAGLSVAVVSLALAPATSSKEKPGNGGGREERPAGPADPATAPPGESGARPSPPAQQPAELPERAAARDRPPAEPVAVPAPAEPVEPAPAEPAPAQPPAVAASAQPSPAASPPASPAPEPVTVATPHAAAASPAPPARGRRPARPRRSAPRRQRVSVQPVATAGAPPPAVATERPERRTARPRPATRPEPESRPSPITRTVTRVVEVVPPPVRNAIAALALLLILSALAVALVALRNRRLQRLRRRLADDVGLLQSALLPTLGRIGEVQLSAAYRPAEGLAAGGDFYDAFELAGGRVGLIVGDVAGHGRDAIPMTAMVRYTIRAYLEAGLEPRAAMAVAARVLDHQLAGNLVTVVAAVMDPATGRLAYASAGHPGPVLIGVDADPTLLGTSPLLGAGVPTGRRQVTVTLPVGTAACFFTDGLMDLRRDGRHLGLKALTQIVQESGHGAAAGDLMDRLVRAGGTPSDDMVVCMIRPLSGPTTGDPSRLEEIEVDDADLRDGRAEEFLVASGVPRIDVPSVVGRAFDVVDRAGTAVLVVRVEPHCSRVRVEDPAPAVLTPR